VNRGQRGPGQGPEWGSAEVGTLEGSIPGDDEARPALNARSAPPAPAPANTSTWGSNLGKWRRPTPACRYKVARRVSDIRGSCGDTPSALAAALLDPPEWVLVAGVTANSPAASPPCLAASAHRPTSPHCPALPRPAAPRHSPQCPAPPRHTAPPRLTSPRRPAPPRHNAPRHLATPPPRRTAASPTSPYRPTARPGRPASTPASLSGPCPAGLAPPACTKPPRPTSLRHRPAQRPAPRPGPPVCPPVCPTD
jgi:hypothetical protein